MKRTFTVYCLFALCLSLFAPSLALAGGHHGHGGYRCGGGGFWSNFAYSQRGYVRPSYASRCYYPTYQPSYYGGGYYQSYGYQPTYYGGGQSVVVVSQPKPRPNIPITVWNENQLEELALNKFTFTRGLNVKTNRIEIQIVARDYHSDTGALKKVKFQVRWVFFKHLKDHDEEVDKKDTIKLKFDEYGRFTEFDD